MEDATRRRTLYGPLEPRRTGHLPLDSRHAMYWEECGNPDGIPVVFLHGGPGAGSSSLHRRFFDPARYRIVICDQRGAGRSTPRAEVIDNTTPHLIDDLERLRRHLGIERWLLFGGSWGSLLALALAEAHPEHCLGLILRGIFLGGRAEVDWFLYGLERLAPVAWQDFAGHLPEAERDDLLGNYHRRLMDDDPAIHLPAARAWSIWEGSCATLMPSPETVRAFGSDRLALTLARIEAHYFVNDCFLGEDEILRNLDRIRHLPCGIVQGRYDLICPLGTADALARAWPEAGYTVVPDAGHSALEPGLTSALIAATDRFPAGLDD